MAQKSRSCNPYHHLLFPGKAGESRNFPRLMHTGALISFDVNAVKHSLQTLQVTQTLQRLVANMGNTGLRLGKASSIYRGHCFANGCSTMLLYTPCFRHPKESLSNTALRQSLHPCLHLPPRAESVTERIARISRRSSSPPTFTFRMLNRPTASTFSPRTPPHCPCQLVKVVVGAPHFLIQPEQLADKKHRSILTVRSCNAMSTEALAADVVNRKPVHRRS